MFIPERIRSSIADADLLAGPIVQMIFVLRAVFMLANHYTALDEGHGMLTTGAPVFDNLHRITGLGCDGEAVQCGLPAANRLLIDVELQVSVPAGG